MRIFLIEENFSKDLVGFEKSNFYKFLKKSEQTNSEAIVATQKIINEVKKYGDSSLIKLSNKFDKTNFKKPHDFIVDKNEISEAEKKLPEEIKKALKHSMERISFYHEKQMPKDFSFTDDAGVNLGNKWSPIQSIGVYVPGGTASYPSSVLMSVVPALVAGVKEIAICAPSNQNQINPAVLFAAKICGVKKIYKIGGAQAISALAYGTKTISKVNKIVGPGNSYVANAKKILYGEVGIDMIAGPTDITIIADESANVNWLACDALSQLEHGVDSKAFLITDKIEIAKKFISEIKKLSPKLPRHKIIIESLKNSAVFVIKNINESFHLANFIAPEHLEIVTKNPENLQEKILNAGAIFTGNYTPEAIGDYIAGPSHTLPTSGTAKFSSGLSVYDFLKRISIISCDKNSFSKLAKTASILANCEGLQAHKLSIEVRK